MSEIPRIIARRRMPQQSETVVPTAPRVVARRRISTTENPSAERNNSSVRVVRKNTSTAVTNAMGYPLEETWRIHAPRAVQVIGGTIPVYDRTSLPVGIRFPVPDLPKIFLMDKVDVSLKNGGRYVRLNNVYMLSCHGYVTNNSWTSCTGQKIEDILKMAEAEGIKVSVVNVCNEGGYALPGNYIYIKGAKSIGSLVKTVDGILDGSMRSAIDGKLVSPF